MTTVMGSDDLATWRAAAGELLRAGIHPQDVRWTDPLDMQEQLEFSADSTAPAPARPSGYSTPREFLRQAELALCHRDAAKWDVLYRILWRLTRDGERTLLSDPSDEDVRALDRLTRAVRRDAHKMKAFVRFRRVEHEGRERFIAWHRPDHRIVKLIAPFFARRFGVMQWSILTPVGSAHWDGVEIRYTPPASRRDAPSGDALEDMWRTYYASIFNPARANERAMRREMPQRYWAALPEASIIDDLLHGAEGRTGAMVGRAAGASGAAAFIPERVVSLGQLRTAASVCRGCEICESATQTVFGEGPERARLVLVGEQPGDEEDRAGRAFVGPAGQVLDRALHEAGIERSTTYITNAVKHFKWTPRGKRRMHSRPSAREVIACKPWLEAEMALIKPEVLVLLGSTAAHAVLGAGFRVMQSRGRIIRDTPWAGIVVPTIHPSAVLRAGEGGQELFQLLVSDLRQANALLEPARLRDAG